MYIDHFVDGVIEYCGSNNVEDICISLDIVILETPRNSSILSGNTGVYIREFYESEVIFIEENIDFKYREFIIAHEIGHAVMHSELNNAAFKNTFFVKNKQEVEANLFALKLLDIKFDKAEDVGLSYSQIAAKYSIPETIVMEYLVK